jgi:hypothetical protein
MWHRAVRLVGVGSHEGKAVRTAAQSREMANGLRMIPIGVAVAAALLVGVGTAVSVLLVSLLLLGSPSLHSQGSLPLADLLDLIKLALAAIAGVGGTVALVVAYRRQRVAEAGSRLEHAKEDRERFRVLNERFSTAASQLGSDQPTVRLAGVYTMSSLADDWREQRQTCVDVLCGYLRMPYEPDPGKDAPAVDQVAFARDREVRHAVIQVIRDHLNPRAGAVPWQDCKFDFRGAVFDGGNFSYMEIPEGCVLNFLETSFVGGRNEFQGCRFIGGLANFWKVNFAGGEVLFFGAEFAGGHVGFGECNFSEGLVDFRSIDTSEGPDVISFGTDVTFAGSTFNGANVLFTRARFIGGVTDFARAKFSGGKVDFADVILDGGIIDFQRVIDWSTPPLNLQSSEAAIRLPELLAR